MLEINQRPINDLRRLIELIGQRRVERELNVHRTTGARWLSGARIPGPQNLAVRALLGDLPGTCSRWTGWRFHDGLLLSPAGEAFTAGQVMAIGLQRQRIEQLQRDLLKAKARVRVLSGLRLRRSGFDPPLGDVANDVHPGNAKRHRHPLAAVDPVQQKQDTGR